MWLQLEAAGVGQINVVLKLILLLEAPKKF
jgi:hypothetical protein